MPQISVICGASAGGGSYAPALTDFVIMTEHASMFLTGPGRRREVTGEDVDAAALGGHRVHERNGVCQLVAATDVDAALLARDLLDYLPQNAESAPLRWPAIDPPGPPRPSRAGRDRRVYDVRDVARALLDGGPMLEISPRWARNVVCARPPRRALDRHRRQPAALPRRRARRRRLAEGGALRRHCNLFGIPLLVLVDTPGFLPGTKQEKLGVIRQGAKLVYAFSECTVPRVTVILRKAFGGAFIAMNSKELGADFVFAWPSAQLGVMGAPQAVEIINRREIEAADDPVLRATRSPTLRRRAPAPGRPRPTASSTR